MGGSELRDYLKGYIVVKAEGLNPEKFINMASRYGVKLWDIRRVSFTTIEFKMRHNQYHLLKKIIQKTGSKTKVMKKYGLNFLLNKVNKRKFFLFGIFIFIAIIFYLSSLVWRIEIVGNKSIKSDKIYETIKKHGLQEGKFKYYINLREIEKLVLKDIKEISIVNISFNGTKAHVEIVERAMPPGIIKSDIPQNIVSSKDGIITKVLAYKGQPVVKSGDYVKKGTILISGVITDANDSPQEYVNSMGEVYAKTWYEGKEEMDLNYKLENRTGRYRTKEYIVVGGKKIYLKNDTIDFELYDKIEEKSKVTLGAFESSVERVKEIYYEKNISYKKLTYEEAVKIAVQKIEDRLKETMPANPKVLDKKVDKSLEDGVVKTRILYITEEKISEQQPINQ